VTDDAASEGLSRPAEAEGRRHGARRHQGERRDGREI